VNVPPAETAQLSIPILWYLWLAAALFAVGATGVILRRSTIVMMMGLELMINAVNLLLVAFSHHHGDTGGQVFVMFTMAVAAAEVAVGLAIVVLVYRNTDSTDTSLLSRLKG
jgi:NADH-quinone oxidoreductase subunit K